MKLSAAFRIAVLVLLTGFTLGCEKQTGVPGEDAASADASQRMLLNRASESTGISPSRTWVPAVSRLPEGTPITIRLQSAVSSVSSDAGDSFEGILDDPIM